MSFTYMHRGSVISTYVLFTALFASTALARTGGRGMIPPSNLLSVRVDKPNRDVAVPLNRCIAPPVS